MRPSRCVLLCTVLLLSLSFLLGACSDNHTTDPLTRSTRTMAKLIYPETRTDDVMDEYHGTQVSDPYRWLEDTGSEETAAWVRAQNELTFDYLAAIPAREHYRQRLRELWDYERTGVPHQRAGRLFFSRNDGLQPQPVLYVQDDSTSAPRVLLDANLLSEDGTVALADWSLSRDGNWLAWSTSVSGSDWRIWRVREVTSGSDLPDEVHWSRFSGATWINIRTAFRARRHARGRMKRPMAAPTIGSTTAQSVIQMIAAAAMTPIDPTRSARTSTYAPSTFREPSARRRNSLQAMTLTPRPPRATASIGPVKMSGGSPIRLVASRPSIE